MAVAVTYTYTGQVTVNETYSGGDLGSQNVLLTFNAFNVTQSNVAGQVRAGGAIQLVSGAATIDLTALTNLGTNGATINGTGFKVLALLIQAQAANANTVTVAQGGANPYTLWGATYSITLQPGQHLVFFGNAAASVIGAANKTIALTGTGAQGINLEVVMG